jgi:3-dehydroquinate synthetase
MRGTLDPSQETELRELIQRLGALPPVRDLRVSDALDAIQRDKKHVAGTLHFILARGVGATVEARNVTVAELRTVMRSTGLRS